MEIKWYCGLAIRDARPAAEIAEMARRGSLADLMQRGVVKSAWDDYDSEHDAFMGRKSAHIRDAEEKMRLEALLKEKARQEEEHERVKRIQQERLELIERMNAEREAKEIAELAAQAVVADELAAIEGFGSF